MTQAYPLTWPQGWPRSKTPVSSKLRTSVPGAVKNVMDEIRRFAKDTGVDVLNVVVSSNVTLTTDRPADSGVAVYFRWDNIDCCIPVDRYKYPEENLQAIARIIEAERTKLRHGGLNFVRSSFRGFASLPPPTGPAGQLMKPWRDVLSLSKTCTLADAERRYREMVKREHPDAGGDAAKFNLTVEAIRQARIELGA